MSMMPFSCNGLPHMLINPLHQSNDPPHSLAAPGLKFHFMPPKLRHCEDKITQLLETSGLKIGNRLNEGRQGSVYTLANTQTGKITNVLKVTTPDGWGIAPFEPNRGSHLIARIKHRNICTPTQFFYLTENNTMSTIPEPKSTCIGSVMPYIKGDTLLMARPSISAKADSVFRFGLSLAEALKELSANNIEHLDLHQNNIIINENKEPVLIDFDLCIKNPDQSLLKRINATDRQRLINYLRSLINDSPDIKRGARIFLISCLDKAEVLDNNPKTAELSRTFMQACIDHLSEIKRKPVSRL